MAATQIPLHEDRPAVLTRFDLLARLSEDERSELSGVGTRRRLATRERVIEQGERGAEFYVVLSGRLRVLSTSAEDRTLTEAILGPGEVFGEIALLDALPRTASVEAMEPSEVLAVTRDDLLPFLERHPRVTLELLGAMAAKMRRLCQFVDDTLFLTLPVRLARRLVELAERFGRETEGGLRVEMRLTQAELGALVGATRESVNKQLREWEEQDILQMRNGQLVIQRRDRLASVANGIPD